MSNVWLGKKLFQDFPRIKPYMLKSQGTSLSFFEQGTEWLFPISRSMHVIFCECFPVGSIERVLVEMKCPFRLFSESTWWSWDLSQIFILLSQQVSGFIYELERRPVCRRGYSVGARTAPRFPKPAHVSLWISFVPLKSQNTLCPARWNCFTLRKIYQCLASVAETDCCFCVLVVGWFPVTTLCLNTKPHILISTLII